MRILRRVLDFFLYSNLFIALVAVAMTATTVGLHELHLAPFYYLFVFCGTLGSYSFHWYLTGREAMAGPRLEWVYRHRRVYVWLMCAAMLGLFWSGLYLACYYLYLVPAALFTFLYSAPKIDLRPFRFLRRVAVLKTLYLTLVWTYVAALVPQLIASESIQWAWVANRFLLVYAVCWWFDDRDRAIDRESRWLTLVSMLSYEQGRRVFYGLVFLFFINLYNLDFSLWQTAWIAMPMLLLVASEQKDIGYRTDYWYYFYLDGLLAISIGGLLPVPPW